MSLERINLYNPVQEQLNVLRDMRRYHQEMQDADIVASLNVQFADSLKVAESESAPDQSVHVRKCDRKERARRHRKANRTHKTRDRYHGKKGEEYRYAEGACRDMRLYNGGMVYGRNIRRERLETARVNSALDISRVERLTASVLAHMSNHVFMWDEQLVYDLTEALCEEYRQVFPDDSYICVYGSHVNLYMQYMDGSVMVDEQCYTLR